MAHLALSFLGGFRVLLDGHPVTEFKSNKVRALLAYLAVESDRPHRREALAGLLWPDRADRDAISNLRYTLSNLRRALGDPSRTIPFLLITHDAIQFNRASDTWLDVAELERQIVGRRLAAADVDVLKSAITLYQGSFLEGFSIGDAAPFEEWALLRREQAMQQVMSALDTLVIALESHGEYKEAQTYARQQVALEPWNEAAHRALMRSLALDGQRSAALHQFQTCSRILQDELGVEPAEETTALYEAIRRGERETSRQNDKGGSRQGTREAPLPTYPLGSPSPPVVAREEQLDRLATYLEQTLAGAGRVVFVTGEAGSGKTALLGEFSRRAMQTRADLLVADGTCNAAAGIGDPYLPFREILQVLTGDIESKRAGATLTPEHARRLWTAMPDAVQALAQHGPGLIDTFVPKSSLELRAEAFAGWSGRSPRQEQLRQVAKQSTKKGGDGHHPAQISDLFQEVTDVLHTLARRHPLTLVLDDLQWADAGTLSLLFHLGRRLAGNRILVVAAYRPDAIAPQPEADRRILELVIRELQRLYGVPPIDLDACEGRQFVEALLDRQPNRLDAEFREQLFRHTEGHPLFTVELLKGLEEQGDIVRGADGSWSAGPALHWERLPARVEAVIAERIGRLPDRCQRLLAAASVEGEEFTAEAAARVLDLDERAVVHCLSGELAEQHRLVSAVSLRRVGARRLSRYRFRHTLFQQYLYDRLDTVRRARWHEAVGNALEQLAGETSDEIEALAPRLAWHFEEAGLADRAATYHLRAGDRAARLSAHDEAIAHFTRGAALLEALPDSPERKRLKLDLQLAAVSPLMIARGFWASKRLSALESAYEIAQNPLFDNSPERWTAQATVAYIAFWSAEPKRCLQLSQPLLHLAELSGDPQQLMLAHHLIGSAWSQVGDLALARDHLDRALALYDRRGHNPMDLILGIHAGVASLVWKSVTLWLSGYPDQASQILQQALMMAQEARHLTTLDFAQVMVAMIRGLLGRDVEATWKQVEDLQSPDLSVSAVGAWIDSLAGWVRVQQGQVEQGLEQMQRGMATADAVGGRVGRATQRVFLAQSYARAGQAKTALALMDEALVWMEQTEVRLLEAEAHRLRGEILLVDERSSADAARLLGQGAAEVCFQRAIDIARQQGARWWELRAVVSLYRLLKERGPEDASRVEARRMLAEIYGWHGEGFDTRDLQEARELLQE